MAPSRPLGKGFQTSHGEQGSGEAAQDTQSQEPPLLKDEWKFVKIDEWKLVKIQDTQSQEVSQEQRPFRGIKISLCKQSGTYRQLY